jgi:hypothetical protein
MPDRWAVASGNWSSTATWNGGTLPGVADDVYLEGFTVTLDQNVTVASIRQTIRSGGTVGNGTLAFQNNRTIVANLYCDSVVIDATTATGLTWTGNVYGGASSSGRISWGFQNTWIGDSYGKSVSSSEGVLSLFSGTQIGNSYGATFAATNGSHGTDVTGGLMIGNAYASTYAIGVKVNSGILIGNVYAFPVLNRHGCQLQRGFVFGNAYGADGVVAHGIFTITGPHAFFAGKCFGGLEGGNGINVVANTYLYAVIFLAQSSSTTQGYGIRTYQQTNDNAVRHIFIKHQVGAFAALLDTATNTDTTKFAATSWFPRSSPLKQGVIR